MRKKFIPLSLALCLTLSGCGGNVVLERSYSVSTPHSEVYWENEGADTLRADSYQDLVNALLLLLGEHSEEGVVRIYSEEDAAAMAEQACKEVQEETALGAYLLDYISYTDTQERPHRDCRRRQLPDQLCRDVRGVGRGRLLPDRQYFGPRDHGREGFHEIEPLRCKISRHFGGIFSIFLNWRTDASHYIVP